MKEMTQVKYAGFGIRLIADCIDSLILDAASCLVVLMLLGVVYWVKILGYSHSDSELSLLKALDPFVIQILLVFFRGILSLGYFIWGTYKYGTTLGKRCFRIYVYSLPEYTSLTLGQSTIRCFSYLISYIPFGAGFLMVLFHPQKRALHDLLSGTVCVVRPKASS